MDFLIRKLSLSSRTLCLFFFKKIVKDQNSKNLNEDGSSGHPATAMLSRQNRGGKKERRRSQRRPSLYYSEV